MLLLLLLGVAALTATVIRPEKVQRVARRVVRGPDRRRRRHTLHDRARKERDDRERQDEGRG